MRDCIGTSNFFSFYGVAKLLLLWDVCVSEPGKLDLFKIRTLASTAFCATDEESDKI